MGPASILLLCQYKSVDFCKGIVTSLRSRNAELEQQLQAERQSSQSKYNESNKQWERDKRDLHILKVS